VTNVPWPARRVEAFAGEVGERGADGVPTYAEALHRLELGRQLVGDAQPAVPMSWRRADRGVREAAWRVVPSGGFGIAGRTITGCSPHAARARHGAQKPGGCESRLTQTLLRRACLSACSMPPTAPRPVRFAAEQGRRRDLVHRVDPCHARFHPVEHAHLRAAAVVLFDVALDAIALGRTHGHHGFLPSMNATASDWISTSGVEHSAPTPRAASGSLT
jgi:hypothetical protein